MVRARPSVLRKTSSVCSFKSNQLLLNNVRYNSTLKNPEKRSNENYKSSTQNLRNLISRLFVPRPDAVDSLTRYHRQRGLSRFAKNEDEDELFVEAGKPSLYGGAPVPIESVQENAAKISPLDTLPPKYDFVTSVLYWYSLGISLNKSDFERLLPPKNLRVGDYPDDLDHIDFEVVRSRNPLNLAPWYGYYLIFNSREAAAMYYQETLGAELCGLQLRLKFAKPDAKGIHSALLDKAPGITRRMCALIFGLPEPFTQLQVLRTLWEYDLVDNDDLAVERLPTGRVKYGGGPFLLRFKNEMEPLRLCREFNRREFPYSGTEVLVDVLD